MSEKNEKLTKKELRKFSLRYAITAQASQSYEAMQGIACVYSMGPFFEKWFADDPELMQKKFQNNLKFFNCQTYFGAAITAAALAIEQDRDPSSLQLAASLKTSLMGPFSGIGDALFNTIPKVVMGAMTAYAAIEGNWITMQCARPCHDTLYSSLEVAEKLSAAEQGGHVPTELVPRCPKCGGPMDIHMGAGQRMIPDAAAQARFQNFLKTYHGKKLVVLELGIGWRNQLIKAPMMRLVAGEPNATYVTINLGEIYIADNIKEKSFGLDGRLDELLPALREACEV